MENQIIPVVFATDENYVVPTYVAAYSLLKSNRNNKTFDIFIMVPDSMTKAGKEVLESLQKFDNCAISFLNMKNAFQNIKMQISYITPATYYRLLLPELLPQYDKCLYLDSDIIVVQDVTEFFYSIPDSAYLAGIVAGNPPLSSLRGDERTAHAKRLNIKSIDNYVNAGVLAFNIKEMREDNLSEKFMSLISQNYPYQDQDILNSVCNGRIFLGERKYNVCPLNGIKSSSTRIIKSEKDRISDAYQEPVIIHYAQPQKPWLSRSFPMAGYWWNCYDELEPCFKKEYLDGFIRHNRMNAIKVRIKHNKIIMGTWQKLKKFKKAIYKSHI